MMDMGGSPSASNDDRGPFRLNKASKNSKLRAVAFDFHVLAGSWNDEKESADARDADRPQRTELATSATLRADAGTVNRIASLLDVEIGEQDPADLRNSREDASLRNIAGSRVGAAAPSGDGHRAGTRKTGNPHEDVRAKYASKLKGGLAGVELAKSQVEESLQRGDAAGHLAARKIVSKTANPATPKWMALSGTGRLLSYLSNRSIHIALLPADPTSTDVDPQMHHLGTQMKDIVIDAVLDPEQSAANTIATLQRKLPDDIETKCVMVVSERDDYLRAARDAGMITCRLRKPNARRGNITTHYDVEGVPQIQDVVNEIAGISFNAVLNR